MCIYIPFYSGSKIISPYYLLASLGSKLYLLFVPKSKFEGFGGIASFSEPQNRKIAYNSEAVWVKLAWALVIVYFADT